uniref:Uncharacterized protein n=1 Tax=Zooxanthella nutricula TaxID=1333877 RepID=A0A7S2NE78_9DINO
MQGVPLQGVPFQDAPGPNSLLSDLRAIQEPGGRAFGAGGGAAPFGAAGAQMQQPQQPHPATQGGMGLGMPGVFSPPGGSAQPSGALGGPGAGVGQAAMGLQAGGAAEPPVDLGCSAGPRAAGWLGAKRCFRSLFAAPGGSPLLLPGREAMSAAFEAALGELKAVGALTPEAADDCGLGKLALQLLSFASMEDPTALALLFTGVEQLASPVMTVLLDVPWAATGQTGWPIFGLLSLISMRRGTVPEALNTLEVDGLSDASGQTFQTELIAALQAGDSGALDRASSAYLQRLVSPGSALAPLTALAAQVVGRSDAGLRMGMLRTLQGAMQQAIGSAGELDIGLGTHWPLWGLLQMALEPLSG